MKDENKPIKTNSWDHELTQKLVSNGLTREQAGFVIGIVAEQRQTADRQGYCRGYDNGWIDAKKGKCR